MLLAVTAAGGRGPRGQVFVCGVIGYPLTPFVVGVERGSDDEDGKNTEDDFHGHFRIA